jgi:hypothetical protein
MSNPATTSGLKSADAAILSMPGRLMGLTVLTDGTNDATVVLYDNTAASGTELAKLIVKGADLSKELVIAEEGVVCNRGIYADVTGTGAAYIVHFTVG